MTVVAHAHQLPASVVADAEDERRRRRRPVARVFVAQALELAVNVKSIPLMTGVETLHQRCEEGAKRREPCVLCECECECACKCEFECARECEYVCKCVYAYLCTN